MVQGDCGRLHLAGADFCFGQAGRRFWCCRLGTGQDGRGVPGGLMAQEPPSWAPMAGTTSPFRHNSGRGPGENRASKTQRVPSTLMVLGITRWTSLLPRRGSRYRRAARHEREQHRHTLRARGKDDTNRAQSSRSSGGWIPKSSRSHAEVYTWLDDVYSGEEWSRLELGIRRSATSSSVSLGSVLRAGPT